MIPTGCRLLGMGLLGLWTLGLWGCGGEPKTGLPAAPPDIALIAEPTPSAEPVSRYGNPPFYEVFGIKYAVMPSSAGYREQGIASWYGPKFHGKRTSSGDTYDMYSVSAAHKTLPIPTYVRVTRRDDGRSIVVRVDDRGPFVEGRIIDLSYAAALKLGIVEHGTAPVEVQALPPYQYLPGYGPDTRLARDDPAPAPPDASSLTTAAALNPPQATAVAIPAVWLQVGAFSQRQNAEVLRRRLLAQVDHGVHIAPAQDQALFRVRVGPFDGNGEALRVAETLAAAGIQAVPLREECGVEMAVC